MLTNRITGGLTHLHSSGLKDMLTFCIYFCRICYHATKVSVRTREVFLIVTRLQKYDGTLKIQMSQSVQVSHIFLISF